MQNICTLKQKFVICTLLIGIKTQNIGIHIFYQILAFYIQYLVLSYWKLFWCQNLALHYYFCAKNTTAIPIGTKKRIMFSTGKSVSEALILESVNPQYD